MYPKVNNEVSFEEEGIKTITFSLDCIRKKDYAFLKSSYNATTGDLYVNKFYVHKSLRGRKYGSLLLSSFLEYCDSIKSYAIVDVIPEDGLGFNELVNFYERYGFKQLSTNSSEYMYHPNTMCVNRTAVRIKKKLEAIEVYSIKTGYHAYDKYITLTFDCAKYLNRKMKINIFSNYSSIPSEYNIVKTVKNEMFFTFDKQVFYSEDELINAVYKTMNTKEMPDNLKHYVSNICNENFKEPIYISFTEQGG